MQIVQHSALKYLISFCFLQTLFSTYPLDHNIQKLNCFAKFQQMYLFCWHEFECTASLLVHQFFIHSACMQTRSLRLTSPLHCQFIFRSTSTKHVNEQLFHNKVTANFLLPCRCGPAPSSKPVQVQLCRFESTFSTS